MSGWHISPYAWGSTRLIGEAFESQTMYEVRDESEQTVCSVIRDRELAEQIVFLGSIPHEQRAERLLALLQEQPPQSHALIDRLGTVLEDVLATNRHIAARLSELLDRLPESASASSVQLEQDSKGQVKLTVKRYADSPFGDVGDDAVREFGRLYRLIEQQQAQAWRDTAESLERLREAAGDA